METIITIYSREDIKKAGGFKKKNNVLVMTKTDFFKYLSDNFLNISSNYIDISGKISNGKSFRCSYNGLPLGTSGIVKEFI